MAVTLLRVAVLAMIFIGSVANLKAVWDFADLSMGLMALINLVAIVWLSPVAFRILKDYEIQLKAGKHPTFDPDDFKKLRHEANRDAWDQ